MTVYSMTMSSTVRTFGGAPTDKWAAYNWNAFKWGEGTDTIGRTIRQQVNTAALTVTPTSTANWRFVFLLTSQSVSLSDAFGYDYRIGVGGGTFTVTDLFEHGYVQDPNDYFRVFPEGVTDLTLRSTPTWAQAASSAAAWSTATVGTTTWS